MTAARESSAVGQLPPYRCEAADVLAALGVDPRTGLAAEEVRLRRERHGRNELPPRKGRGVVLRWLDQLRSPLVIVLLAAAGITATIGEYVDSAVIGAVVLLNAVVGFVQESKARQALDALTKLVRTDCTVVRDSARRVVASAELVPGDVIVLDAGDRVPADARLVGCRDLECDESVLTGESLPVAKAAEAIAAEVPLGDRASVVHSGTMVTRGTATAVVVATGTATEIGAVQGLVASATAPLTPLTRKLARFSKQLTALIVAVAVATFVVGIARGTAAADMFVAAVALAVGAIPEGLPAAVTVVLAIGVVRMARRRAIVRNLPAVETLGSTTVIFSDKTGTLTENAMTVAEIYAGGERYAVTGSGFAPEGAVHHTGEPIDLLGHPTLVECLVTGVLCNDAELRRADGTWQVIGDPTEAALLTVAAKAGLDTAMVRAAAPRVDVLPFESARQLMVTTNRTADGRVIGHVKGAVERVLDWCRDAMDADETTVLVDHDVVLEQAKTLAREGLRVLACARFTPADPSGRIIEDQLPGRLTLLGLVAMADLPRAGVPAAVRACRDAGIAVKMITGDHADTARTVASKIGLGAGAGPVVITGTELTNSRDDELDTAAARADVFARVSPEQKLDLVQALQRQDHVVAMTGDGVNDAPALRRADIGVAMGDIGTEVARDAADMVLADDDFASIEAAVEEGRGVFDNLRKFITWTLPTNIGEGLVIVAAVLLGTALPMLPVQILWINMTTAGFLGLTLAFEPKESGIMRRPPRPPGRSLLTADLVRRIALVSTVLVIGAFAMFQWQISSGASTATARTAAINVFVFAEMAFLLSCRSFERMVPRSRNPWLFGGIATMTLLQLALTYTPPMQAMFHTAALDLAAWAVVAAVAATTYVLVELDKLVWRRRDRDREFDHTGGTAA